MSRTRRRMAGGGLTAVLLGISVHGAAAQSELTGVILSGASLSSGTGASSRLMPGSRIASPARSWTEIVFSDGSSIVLGPGAALTVRQMAAGPGSAGNRISATGSGQMRVTAMDRTQIELATPEAAITVIAADAVLHAGSHGSVAMMGGREVVVSQGSRQDTLRRPGFSMPLDGSGPRRDSDRQLVAAVAPFAPSSPDRSPVATAATPARPAPSVKRTLRLPSIQAAATPTEVAAAGSTDLTTGLTAQSGSFALSPTLTAAAKLTPSAAVPATIVPVATPSQATIVPAATPSPAQNNTVPDIPVTPFFSTPTAGGELPAEYRLPVPTQPSFVPIDSALLAKFPGASGLVTVPGTTTSVSAGLIPSNEHLAWGIFVPAGVDATPATALANPSLAFSISSTALPTGSLQALTGTATYTGGMIANTPGTSGNLRATGQFAQTWNFGTRSGSLNAVFGGITWNRVPLITQTSGGYTYTGVGNSVVDQRLLSFQGDFYNKSPVIAAGSFPGATGGQFFIGPSLTGKGGSVSGIFVGTQR